MRLSKITATTSLIAVALAVVTASWLISSEHPAKSNTDRTDSFDRSGLTPKQLASLQAAEAAINESEALDVNQSNDSSSTSSQPKPLVLKPWAVAANTSTSPNHALSALHPRIKTAAALEIDTSPQWLPELGDEISLDIPLEGEIKAKVESTKMTNTGDYVLSGHLAGYDNEYPIVVTYGNNKIYATITTPSGAYTMESENGSGVIFKNPSEIELSKPGSTDYLEPTVN